MNVRGRGLRLLGVAVAALSTIALIPGGSASGQNAGVSVNAGDTHLVYGQDLKVRGRVGTARKGQRVRLEYAPRGRGYRTVDSTKTGRRGGYALRHEPVRSGTLRVRTGGASASRSRTVRVAARIATAEREHVRAGRTAEVVGRLRPGYSGRRVRIQLRKKGRWVTVALDRTGREGRFKGSWRVKRGAGKYRTRVMFRGDARNAKRVDRTRLFVYRPGQASYYGPGLYGNRTACGQTLTPGTLGVANRWLPCGTRVTFRYRGNVVTVPVIDRGPFHGSRIWDLTYATKRSLGFGSTGVVWSTR